MGFDPKPGMDVLEANRQQFGAAQKDQNEYLAEARKRLGERTPDDRREAGKLAVEAAKMFVTIGVAGFAVIGGFVQFARNAGFEWTSWPVLLFAASASLVLISMTHGFLAMSRTYKRADGRLDPAGLPWSTDAIRTPLNRQALFGLLSLLTFAGAIASSGYLSQQPVRMMTISVPSRPTITTPTTAQVVVEGEWANLAIRTKSGPLVQLPPVPAGQKDSVSIIWK